MRLVIFSDIHGNSYAFDAFLEKIKDMSYDYLVFCGDIFGYYYDQKKVIKQLCRLSETGKLIWLKGNHDEYFLKLYKSEDCGHGCDVQFFNGNGNNCDEHTLIADYGHSYEQVKRRFTDKEAELVASHAPQYVLETEGIRIGIFHGTPNDTLEGRLYPDKPVSSPDKYCEYDIVILGHTHCRMIRYEGKTLIVNSGSLGQPRDGSGYGFAVLDTASESVEFFNVEIDHKLLYKQIDRFDPNLKKLKDVLERERTVK